MTLPPQPTQPAPLAPAGVAAPTSRLPLPWAVAGVATAAAGLAALVAWFVDRSLGSPGWAAPLGALVGVAAAVAPAALALQRLLQRADPSALVGGTLHSPLGAARPLFLELAQYPPALQLTHDAFGCGAFHLCQSNFIARPKESPEHARMDFVSG